MSVRKAVIPAAGLGTRFLPATKSVPKEMLPIYDAPSILYVVEEALAAGIQDMIFISGHHKHAIEDFFDVSYELEDTLARTGKEDLLDRVRAVRDKVNIISIRQKNPKGLGHAVSCARPVVGKDPFAVLLGDEINLPGPNNVISQLSSVYDECGLSAVQVMEVAPEDVEKYGIADVSGEGPIFHVNSFVEKPKAKKSPSRLALPGRYVFTHPVFESLSSARPGKNGEIQLTDSMSEVARKHGMKACLFQSRRYDAGDKLGYMQASIEMALNDTKIQHDLATWLRAKLEDFS